MVAGIRVKGEPDEVLGCPTCMQAKFTCYPFSSSEATAKAPLDEVVMDVVGPLKLGAGRAEYFLAIVDTARGLLIEAGLPDYFWPDAVRSACMAKNRALTHVGADKWVPYVEWIGRKPKVDMLRVFGCMCMALVPKHLRHNKLDAKAIWAVYLGMAQNSKGWLLWDPFTKKFLVSRDCKFMENLMNNDWKAKNEAKICMPFGEVKSFGLEHVDLPLELRSNTTTRQPSLVKGGEEAKDAEEEEEEVQQVSERAPTLLSRTTSALQIRVTPMQRHESLHVPVTEEEGRGKKRIQAPNRLTYEALGKPAKSALTGAALMVGDDEESDYDDCAFAFFCPVEMPGNQQLSRRPWRIVMLKSGSRQWKFKSDVDGKIGRYKSRLVAKGYQQKEKVDYKELFAPVIGLLKLMIGEEPRPSDPALQEDWDERASAGYYLMSQSLELNQRHHVMHLLPEVDCGPKAWTVLKELHAPTSVVATLMLERELSALRLSEGEPVQPVLDKMRDLYAKLETAGITYPEQTKCLKMLSLLPESWLQFTSGLSLPQNQSLWTLEWVRTKNLEEDFRRRQLRGGDDGSSGYGMQGSKRGRGRGFGGAGRGAKKDDDSNDQQGGTGWGRGAKSGRGGKSGAGGKMKGSCWYCEKEGHPWFFCYKKPDWWTPQNRHQDGGARRNQKNGANMVADSSDNNPKSNGGAEKKKERTAGQFFHIGEQGEQGDASAKVGAELHPLLV
ncbi:unnamed protein product [Closterium sp. NIES-53]